MYVEKIIFSLKPFLCVNLKKIYNYICYQGRPDFLFCKFIINIKVVRFTDLIDHLIVCTYLCIFFIQYQLYFPLFPVTPINRYDSQYHVICIELI